jgi:hypothetical protein
MLTRRLALSILGTAGIGSAVFQQARNLLSGNREHGLTVGSGFGGTTPDVPPTFDNIIQGNFIGTDVTGTIALCRCAAVQPARAFFAGACRR